jgi:hypothetical protein
MEDLSAFSAKPRLRPLLDHFSKIKDTRQAWKVIPRSGPRSPRPSAAPRLTPRNGRSQRYRRRGCRVVCVDGSNNKPVAAYRFWYE